MLKILRWCLISPLVLVAGCERSSPESTVGRAPATPPRAAVSLTVLVVEDSNLATGLNLLRGEWAERSGGEMVVDEWTAGELLDAKKLPFDLVVFPSRYVGTLVARNWLRPVRDSVLKDPAFAFSDIFPFVRYRSMRYGGKIYALSLGEPPLLLGWHVSAAKEAETKAPRSWKQLEELRMRMLASPGVAFPLSTELVVRALSHTRASQLEALLFDPKTMRPRLTFPVFQRALAELLASRHRANAEATEAVAVLTWPSSPLPAHLNWPLASFQFAGLPRAEEVFDASRSEWEPVRQSEPLVVLGFSGRSVGVTHSSRNATSAFKLLGWLGNEAQATPWSSRSTATSWFRKSQTVQARKWLEKSGVGDESIALVSDLLTNNEGFLLPRIPGIDEYLQALEEALQEAGGKGADAGPILAAVSEQWSAITTRLGREAQRAAYRLHLGFDEHH